MPARRARVAAAGEMLVVSEPFLTRNMHPTIIVRAYRRALVTALATLEKMARHVDVKNAEEMRGCGGRRRVCACGCGCVGWGVEGLARGGGVFYGAVGVRACVRAASSVRASARSSCRATATSSRTWHWRRS